MTFTVLFLERKARNKKKKVEMKPDFETWSWCRRNGIRYVECDHANGKIVHFWKSGNLARLRHTRKDTYICSTSRYMAIFFDKFSKK